jgi:hypothetical protein
MYLQMTSNIVTESAKRNWQRSIPLLWSCPYFFYLRSQQLPDFNIYVVNLIVIVSPVFLRNYFFPLCSENLQFSAVYVHSDTSFSGRTPKSATLLKFAEKTQTPLHKVATYTGRYCHHLLYHYKSPSVWCGKNMPQLLARWTVEKWEL